MEGDITLRLRNELRDRWQISHIAQDTFSVLFRKFPCAFYLRDSGEIRGNWSKMKMNLELYDSSEEGQLNLLSYLGLPGNFHLHEFTFTEAIEQLHSFEVKLEQLIFLSSLIQPIRNNISLALVQQNEEMTELLVLYRDENGRTANCSLTLTAGDNRISVSISCGVDYADKAERIEESLFNDYEREYFFSQREELREIVFDMIEDFIRYSDELAHSE